VTQVLAPFVAVALFAAAPNPAPSPSAPPVTLSVVCSRAPLYVFASGSDRPVRARTFAAALGQRFELLGGPRTTLEGAQYYETDIVVTDPGYPPGTRYWLSSNCVVLSR
jgi:hypothetical protein